MKLCHEKILNYAMKKKLALSHENWLQELDLRLQNKYEVTSSSPTFKLNLFPITKAAFIHFCALLFLAHLEFNVFIVTNSVQFQSLLMLGISK